MLELMPGEIFRCGLELSIDERPSEDPTGEDGAVDVSFSLKSGEEGSLGEEQTASAFSNHNVDGEVALLLSR